MTDRDTNDSKSAQQPVMMPAYFPQPSDEIDLFELLEQLWRGKLTILGTMVLALAIGAGASVLSIKPPATPSTEYTVSTAFMHVFFNFGAAKFWRHQQMFRCSSQSRLVRVYWS